MRMRPARLVSYAFLYTTNEAIKGFISPLTRQLEELTRVVKGMVTTAHPNLCPNTDYSTISGTAVHQPDAKTLRNGRNNISLQVSTTAMKMTDINADSDRTTERKN